MLLWRLTWRSMASRRARTAAVVLCVAAAYVAHLLIGSFERAWTHGNELASTARLVARSKESLLSTLPVRAARDLASATELQGKLSHVSHGQWFGARVAGKEREFFASHAVDETSYFQSLGSLEVAPDAIEAFQREPDAAIVGDLLADRMGWKKGDRIALVSGLYPERSPWSFQIVGIHRSKELMVDRSSLYVRWSFVNASLDAGRKDEVQYVLARVTPGHRPTEVAETVKRVLEARGLDVAVEDERAALRANLGFVDGLLRLLVLSASSLVVVTIFILTAAIGAAAQMRRSELAVLRALGFSSSFGALVIAAEALLVGLLGSAVGAALSFVILRGLLGPWVIENLGSIFPAFGFDPGSSLRAAGMFVAACLAGALPGTLESARISPAIVMRQGS